MGPDEALVCEAEGMERLLGEIARRVEGDRRPGMPLALVGVRTRGVPLAERIAGRIAGPVLVGAVDITLYRDDLGEADHWPVIHGTEVDFPVDGTDLVLVDDVLFTGRTARAALNAVCDLGRPGRVRFVALVDRGSRELPIQPFAVGLTLETEPDDIIRVRVRPVDPVDEVVRAKAAAADRSGAAR